jgi:DNA-binding GntR family transcriptional regulator
MAKRSESLVDEATDLLREQVLSGELAPGARVHLADASQRLDMSIVPIREALRSLAGEGLVVSLPQRGYRVTELNRDDFDDMYRLRLVLDPMAVLLAVPKFTQADRAEIQKSFAELEQAYRDNDRKRHAIEHRRFHFAIYEPCDSPWLLRFITTVWNSSARYQQLSAAGGRRGPIQDRIVEHRRILEACLEGDAQRAADVMRAHLQLTIDSIHDVIESQQKENEEARVPSST